MVKLADFGLAKDAAEIKGTACGTSLYMAPEVHSQKHYSQKADMFGFALITWELWYGRDIWDKYTV